MISPISAIIPETAIYIDPAHRLAGFQNVAYYQPTFLYESLWSLVGIAVMLFLWSRFASRRRLLIAGDVGLLYFVWYGVERSVLESLRGGWNWTIFGVPMAQLVGLGAAAISIVAILIRHRYVHSHTESGLPTPLQPEPEPPTDASVDLPTGEVAAS